MRRRQRGFAGLKPLPSTFKIQVTSMVDMFVILLVFLLKSYSTSSQDITVSKDMNLPVSSSLKDTEEMLKLVVSKAGIFLDQQKIVDLQDGQIQDQDVQKDDKQFISKMYELLNAEAEKSRKISSVNSALEFDGKMIVQVDRDISYDLINRVFYTAAQAGFANVKLAVLRKE